jgi:hypothetical protein
MNVVNPQKTNQSFLIIFFGLFEHGISRIMQEFTKEAESRI